MNHHSTNATAASGLAGLGMMPLSGGYAGMPQDFPVRFVQGCMVPDDDARHGLPGEFALRAIQVRNKKTHSICNAVDECMPLVC